MATYLIRFKAEPRIRSANVGEFSGAFFTMWVVSSGPDTAMRRAADYAIGLGWTSGQQMETEVVKREAYLNNAEFLSCFDAAQTLGVVSAIDTFNSRDQN